MVVTQGHPVDDTAGLTGDPNPHVSGKSKPPAKDLALGAPFDGGLVGTYVSHAVTCADSRHNGLDITMKTHARLARSGSENGSVPVST